MKNIINIFQLLISIFLIVLILMQAKGVGLGRAWGGGSEFYKSRRGVEKIIFRLTIVIAALFLISSVFNVLIT
ncbi:preprotein translocase subunit SecG [Candidatus Gottesmanbacteria bacterium RIFCSPHIGHO2_02_FULL_40_13]|uniref:Protein-export membrane protein SecG n=1 Tax=Candidatus Gottesmanbacteria bacterium RIFCSPHIGHO2_02_FULL_40_13 TaxID=1798384 RepID=A0A1F6A6F2_9BACT|nr:MAG: preprotein translocase subunit SecG [Candidatus Gottesmanbacteria bacterium RIFCSPHIGHO2_02_FULL_40_13]